jgi:hypothetical protein
MRFEKMWPLAVAMAVAAACAESQADPAESFVPRNVVAERWDTVFVAGGEHVQDTLFSGPHRVAIAGAVVVVGDRMVERVIGLDRATGAVKWSFGRPGGGPGEFRGISDIAVARSGMIWVLDFGNGRITVLAPDGEFYGVKTLRQLPAPPAAILPLDDRAIGMSHGAPSPFMEIGLDSLELRHSFPLSWPDPVPDLANTRVSLAGGSGDTWVSAFALGPGFTVWDGGTPRHYTYREHIPFAIRPSEELRAMGGDSARNGAVSLEVIGEEIFMLFGGRPHRKAHPGEPTVWIDVYSLQGRYLRSYRLPFHAGGMATDGRTFYFLVTDDIPKLIALRPIEE